MYIVRDIANKALTTSTSMGENRYYEIVPLWILALGHVLLQEVNAL